MPVRRTEYPRCIPSQFLKDIKHKHNSAKPSERCIPSQFLKMSIKTVINQN